jgi:hypothetical protein
VSGDPLIGADPRWWVDLRAAALVGTGRRAVQPVAELALGRRPDPSSASSPAPSPDPSPAPPPDAIATGAAGAGGDAGPDPVRDLSASAVSLLDAAAVGGIARRAGRRARPAPSPPIPVAPDPDGPAAPPVATQLLELLLTTSPAGIHRNDLIAHWCATAAETGHHIPDPLLVRVLEHATAGSGVRPAVRDALGARGWWLAGLNPDWAWAVPSSVVVGPPTGDAPLVDPDEWARLRSAERVEVLADVRHRDPAAGRELVRSTWAADPATARSAHVAVLADGLGPDDEDLLEAALDDRSKAVRQHAALLLDGLGTSARARRMADRLRPLLSIDGRGGARTITVALPDDPDAAGVRDGLVPPPPTRSARGFWVEQLAAGAPLDVWTDLTGSDVRTTVELLATAGPDVRAGVVRAVLARRDAEWAAALHPSVPDPRLLGLLPDAERVEAVERALGAAKPPTGVRLAALLDHLPDPWSPQLSRRVLDVLRADGGASNVQHATPILARSLDTGARATLDAWLAGLEEQPQLAAALRTLIQYQSLHRAITEAFS